MVERAPRRGGGGEPGLFTGLAPRPLADRLRPQKLADIVGQDHLLGPDGPIGRMAASGRLSSMVLWGPPGCGKTTLARLLAEHSDLEFEPLSAVFSGVADLRRIFDKARERRSVGRGTLLFVDEIHRFNRAQQDGFLPYVEDGTVVLIGATTENPSFELNGALLSRCQVFVLNRLDEAAMEKLLARAEAAEGRPLPLDGDSRRALRAMADGDGRYLLNMVEALFALQKSNRRCSGSIQPVLSAMHVDGVQLNAFIFRSKRDRNAACCRKRRSVVDERRPADIDDRSFVDEILRVRQSHHDGGRLGGVRKRCRVHP